MKALIFARTASEDVDMLDQIKLCEKFAIDQEWEVIGTIYKPNCSGIKHEHFKDILDNLGNADILLMQDEARLSRSLLTLTQYKESLENRGVSIRTVSNSIDLTLNSTVIFTRNEYLSVLEDIRYLEDSYNSMEQVLQQIAKGCGNPQELAKETLKEIGSD